MICCIAAAWLFGSLVLAWRGMRAWLRRHGIRILAIISGGIALTAASVPMYLPASPPAGDARPFPFKLLICGGRTAELSLLRVQTSPSRIRSLDRLALNAAQ